MEKYHIMIIRHFDTYKDNEKIKYKESFIKSELFVNYIKKFIDRYPKINKIKFYTSDYDRTIMTSLILSSNLKNKIIDNQFEKIKINDPKITKILDRDPKKKKKYKIGDFFADTSDSKLNDDTLYIYITHSSVIYNLFKSILEYCTNDKIDNFHERIHRYSISTITKNNDKIKYVFNKKII